MMLQAAYVLLGLVCRVVSLDSSFSPGCVSKCWDNSQYLSTCNVETQCLCEDSNFQSAVLQCLYSQCQTTHFGSALHFALSQCAEYGLGTTDILPPLIRHQGLRKRAYPDLKDLSVHAIASATHSVARRLASISAVPYPKPTRSAAYPAANTYANPHSLPTTLITAVLSASGNGTVPQAL